jgi:hypothetical protein
VSGRIGVIALALAVVCSTPAAASAQVRDSRTQIDAALAVLEQAAQSTGPERDARAQEARRLLVTSGLARNDWLRAPLDASPPEIDRARTRLTAARAVLDEATPSAIDVGRARASLDRILHQPPFEAWDPLTLFPDWLVPAILTLRALADGFWRIVRWPFDRVFDLLGTFVTSAVGQAVIVVCGVLVLGGLIFLYRLGLRAAIVAQAEVGPPPTELPPTAREALERAQAQAGAGRYREACHFVFLATLLWIEEHAAAHFDPAATNREHLAQVAGQPKVAAALAPVVARFDRLWYGQDAVGEEDYRALLGLAARVREATP